MTDFLIDLLAVWGFALGFLALLMAATPFGMLLAHILGGINHE